MTAGNGAGHVIHLAAKSATYVGAPKHCIFALCEILFIAGVEV